jgi:hypothetical protein
MRLYVQYKCLEKKSPLLQWLHQNLSLYTTRSVIMLRGDKYSFVNSTCHDPQPGQLRWSLNLNIRNRNQILTVGYPGGRRVSISTLVDKTACTYSWYVVRTVSLNHLRWLKFEWEAISCRDGGWRLQMVQKQTSGRRQSEKGCTFCW